MDENTLDGAIEKLRNMLSDKDGQSQIRDMLGMFSGGAASENADDDEDSGSDKKDMSGMPDAETMLKINRVIGALNKSGGGKHAQFLRALRPYLKEPRQKRLDSAVKLLGVADAVKSLGIFDLEDGED